MPDCLRGATTRLSRRLEAVRRREEYGGAACPPLEIAAVRSDHAAARRRVVLAVGARRLVAPAPVPAMRRAAPARPSGGRSPQPVTRRRVPSPAPGLAAASAPAAHARDSTASIPPRWASDRPAAE